MDWPRPAKLEDGPGYARVRIRSWEHAYQHILKPESLAALDPEDLAEKWQTSIVRNQAWVVDHEGQMIGYVLMGGREDETDPGAKWIHALYVDPEFINTGAGGELMATAIVQHLRQGGTKLRIAAFADNHPARRVYEHWGARHVLSGTYEYDGVAYADEEYVFENLPDLLDKVTPAKIQPLSDNDSVSEATDLLHRAYARSAQMGMHFVASHQDEATTYERWTSGQTWIARLRGKMVGTVTMHQRAVHDTYQPDWPIASFGQFAVEPHVQGRRIGERMLGVVEEAARNAGAEELTLDTSQWATTLIEYYQRNGFRVVADVDYRPVVNYPSFVMAKKLAPGTMSISH